MEKEIRVTERRPFRSPANIGRTREGCIHRKTSVLDDIKKLKTINRRNSVKYILIPPRADGEFTQKSL